ncbi:MAG TPA: 3-hydroxyacyl-CoA dehydrogenase NAD-binding domain-containing protein [Gemmatimonadaceae bacterium]|nr:3-hydroxyacyl-CoA dehydrogenase NAD-binding domain-containing protein [Gemmatimonadaceae bacterium]
MAGRKPVVGVLGAGAMGAGIAQIAALRGHTVVLADAQSSACDSARDRIIKSLAREVEKKRLQHADVDEALERLLLTHLDSTHGYDAFGACDMVIEAIVEQLDAKRTAFRQLEAAVQDDCILASNTSSLSIAAIAAACERPQRALGVHFFNPATVMPLVEIVPGVRTDAAVVATARGIVDGWGKTTVLALDTPGFIVNRVARPYYGEALRILDEGLATISDIDWSMTTLGGFRMGPFELMDFIGHDVNYVVTESVWTALYYDPRFKPSLTQRRLLEAGLLGKKSGRGFYDYANGAERPAAREDRALGDRVFNRILAMLVNEAIDAVYHRITTVADIEVAMTKGMNYPKGLLAWGEEIGLDKVLDEIDRLHDEYHEDRYRASALLRRMVRERKSLFSE